MSAYDRDMHPMEAARAIAAKMYAQAVQHEIATPCEAEPAPDRASLIAAEILESPVSHFTHGEITRYVTQRLPFPPSWSEMDSVLTALVAAGFLRINYGHYTRIEGGAL